VPLVLVATPIGNLQDLSPRARLTLEAADLVVSEDTRRTGVLLRHLGLRRPQLSMRAANERTAVERVLAALRAGRQVAVVSDAGTPGISDPGYALLRRAVAEDIPVTMVPGPSAVIMAVVLSGLPAHAFTFRGFPPRADGARRTFLAADATSPYTLVYYEAPHRLARMLCSALEVFGDRPAAVCVELTKRFERVHRGRLSQLAAQWAAQRVRGEVTVGIAGAPRRPAARAAGARDTRPRARPRRLRWLRRGRGVRCVRVP